MAKQRMYAYIRDRLLKKVDEVCVPKEQKKAVDEAYKKVAPLMRKLVTDFFPPREMLILKKWGVVSEWKAVTVQFHNAVVDEFKFRESEKPLYGSEDYGYRRKIFLGTEELFDLFDTYRDACNALKEESARRRNAYHTLIISSRYVEDVTAVWPEASMYVPPMENNVPMLLGRDQIAIIREDMKERGVEVAAV